MALTERLAIILETVGAAPVVRDFQKVGNASQGLASKLRTVGAEGAGMGGLIQAGAAVAATAVVAFATKSVDAYYDMAQAVLTFQRASGASAEQSSALVAAFDDVGISAEVGSKAIFQLGRRLESSSDKLAAYGITAVRGADGTTDLAQTLLAVADAYVNTTDASTRANLVQDAFGRSGQELIPILERGRQGIEALYSGAAATGQILTQDEVQKAEDFRLAVDELNDAWRQFQIEAGKALVPLLTDLAEAASTTAEWIDKLKIIPAIKWLAGIDGSFEDTAEAGAVLTGTIGDVKDVGQELTEGMDSLEKATLGASNAQRDYEASARAVEKADRTLVDAQADLNKLLREGAVDEEKVADAIRSRDSALRSLGSAQRAQQQAQDDYNEALAYFNAVGGDTAADKLADARDKLADADDAVANAQDRATDANSELAKAQAGDPEFNDKLADAKIRLKDAEQGVADAKYNHAKNANDLNTALTTQNTLLAGNQAAVAGLYDKWAQLLALKPELLPFLQGPLATIAPSATPQGLLSPVTSGQNLSPVTTTNNVTVNVSGAAADPLTLGRNILWNLN